jgi:hypothetical protein
VFNRTNNYHVYWLEKITEMDNDRLDTNTMDLKASRVKEMANELLGVLKTKLEGSAGAPGTHGLSTSGKATFGP